jgi:pimeloyl-ACP methyl ester carboxylesterase
MPADADLISTEAQALNEFFALQRDPVLRGVGVARGDGRLVLVIPGLFGSDIYLEPLRGWLRRIGYRPVRSSVMMNAGCPQRLRNQIEMALRPSRERHPGPLAIIGHSRGGMLAWAIASHLQEQTSHLVLLGSPAPAVVTMMRMNPNLSQFTGVAASGVAQAGQRALRLLDPDCNVPACGCPYTTDLRGNLSRATRVLSICSADDKVVPSRAAEVIGGENLVVRGSHSGLVYNRAVYPAIARFLAAP